jgi:hypothetical protein
MREEKVKDCILPDSVFNALGKEFQVMAPGYVGGDRSFADHEWFKHGVCMGGYLST